ncbi:MAG: DNA gyrase/topoisomerase IV subunit A [Bacteroidota bacterium]|nr:DNA gyrase/topoisomerase IV subunit A [Bacteroidota bacterium]
MSEEVNNKDSSEEGEKIHDITPVSGLYENWFLEYASYVILERAVPAIEDGLKPVQRRILHAMKEMDDGRFNKVANVIGSTMQYHPHGDASIGEAIVGLGQKELLLETQGNWGDIRTGDNAAAPRYIEARLSKFALEVVFNADTTEWQASYDGRKKEPITLPVKFPLLLAQGVEGIAVGLATKVLPHNFCELCDASVKYLKNQPFELYPDFLTGGYADISDYRDGNRGGKIRVRARIEELDKKTLIIKDIPFGTTTSTVIDSIIKANDAGKIKIKKVNDNTAKDVEIEIQLQPGTSPDITIDALYAFTDCEISVSPNTCVIVKDKPRFLGVSEILRICTDQTKDLLRRELEIKKKELQEKILFTSLLRIFIGEGMYKNKEYEGAGNPEKCFEVLNKLFSPFFEKFYRQITNEDYSKLIARPLSSITRFDVDKADEQMKSLENEIVEVEHHLKNLVEYTINWYKNLLEKYGKNRHRRTELRVFDTINASNVAAANEKLYVNKAEGFIGYGLKKDEFVTECSDIDDIIAFRRDGIFKVVRIGEKVFIGKDILFASVFKKNDDRTVYNMIYLDGKSGRCMVKRFQIGGITRDKEYDLTMGNKGSKVIYLEERPNGETETVTVTLTPSSAARTKVFDFNFADLIIKGRGSQGNILTPYPVKSVKFKELGKSSLGGVDIYYEEIIGRLNTEKRGKYLGNFETEDKIFVLYKDGNYELTNFELTNRYEPDLVYFIDKYNPEWVCSLVHYLGEDKTYYVKRFKIEALNLDKKYLLIDESKGSKMVIFTTSDNPEVEITFAASKNQKALVTKVFLKEYIDVKGWKATGNKLASSVIDDIKLLKPISKEEAGESQISLFEPTAKVSVPKEDDKLLPGTTIELNL